jgi:4'-phosphopantetheinyl transferase
MQASRGSRRHSRVGPGEVDAWLIDLEAPPLGAARALWPAELARARSYLSPRDGASFAASRAWLRVILGRYLDAKQGVLEFDTSAGGRPRLAGDDAALIHFSLSRSAGRGLVAVSCSPVGADLEHVRARAGLTDLVAGAFGAAEARCVAAGCGGSPLRGFYRHWTVKEACSKATGRGVAGLQTMELTCGARPIVKVDGRTATWTVSLLDAGPGRIGAIVGTGPVTSCQEASQ